MQRLCAALLAGLLAACATPPRVIELVAPSPATSATSDARQITDYPAAATAIVEVLTRQLGLPVPAFPMEVYARRADFERALGRHLGLAPEVAHSTAAFAKAAVGNRRVLVNEAALASDGWPDRLVTLSHEWVHTSQFELAGHRPVTRHQWLVEGFAEWMAFRVTHELGVNDFTEARRDMTARVRAVWRADGLVPLARLDTLDDWLQVRRARGFDATYPFAFLVTDFLVQRHSLGKVTAYFQRYRASADPATNFSQTFGESLEAFQAALDAHWHRVLY